MKEPFWRHAVSALEKCSFGRRPAAEPFPRHSDGEALSSRCREDFEIPSRQPIPHRLRFRSPALEAFWRCSDDEALFEPMSRRPRSAVTASGSTWSSLSSPCARSVPQPIFREQVSFPNPRRMKLQFRSLATFCFSLRMSRFCVRYS